MNCNNFIGSLTLIWHTGRTLRTGIEQDRRQFNSVKLVMTVFEPKPDLLMVVSPAELVFGHECLEVLGPYREEMGGESSECAACDKTWPGEGFQCTECSLVFCAKCLPARGAPASDANQSLPSPKSRLSRSSKTLSTRPLQLPLLKPWITRKFNVFARFWVLLHQSFRCFYCISYLI